MITLQITQTRSRIGLDITKPSLEIRQPKAELQIDNSSVKIQSIDQGPVRLEVDGDDAHSALGHKPTGRMVAEVAADVRAGMLQLIGDTAAEGDAMMDFQNNSIADIAKQHSERGPMQIDSGGGGGQVHVSLTPHPVSIEWQAPRLSITATQHAPEIQYTPGKVSVYLAQQGEIHIQPKGNYLNMSL